MPFASINDLRGWTALFLIIPGFCFGQIRQTDRLEIPMSENNASNYSIVNARESGLILCHERWTPDHALEIFKLDTLLHEQWRGTVLIDLNHIPVFSQVYNDVLFILCKNQVAGKGDFSLVTLDLSTRNYKIFPIQNYIPFKPTEFLVLGEAFMIGGNFNYRPFVLHYSLISGQSKILPGFFNEQGDLVQLTASSDGIADVMVSAKNADRKKCLWIRNYDNDGTLLKTTVLEPDEGKNLIFGRSLKLPDGTEVVAGAYGKSKEYSSGIFVARIGSDGEYVISYYNYADLQNFFRFMKARREQRVRHRIERRKIRGKKNKFNYRLMVHQLVPYGDQYIMLGEAFYPTYKSAGLSNQSMGISQFGSRNMPMVFDGYQYTHAIVIGFSKDGKLIWDNSFEINDVKSYKLDQFVKIEPEKDHINLLYLMDNEIRTKIIRDEEVLEGKATEGLKTYWENDMKSAEYIGLNKLEYWYPNQLYAYGSQVIFNTDNNGTIRRRKVFFINKISNH